MSESHEQKSLVSWFKYQYPDKIIFSIPNGSWLSGDKRRRAILARKEKSEGLLPGVSDLFIPEPIFLNGHILYPGIFLELKDKGKTRCYLSTEQEQFIEDMKARGFCATWAAGFEEGKEIIEDYLNGKL